MIAERVRRWTELNLGRSCMKMWGLHEIVHRRRDQKIAADLKLPAGGLDRAGVGIIGKNGSKAYGILLLRS